MVLALFSQWIAGMSSHVAAIPAAHSDADADLHAHDGFERAAEAQQILCAAAAGIAHDFNNVLGIILANANFLLDGLAAGDVRRLDAEEIRDAATRAVVLTKTLTALSRSHRVESGQLTPRDAAAPIGPGAFVDNLEVPGV